MPMLCPVPCRLAEDESGDGVTGAAEVVVHSRKCHQKAKSDEK